MIYYMHMWHSGEDACVSCSQIVMGILSDAGWLEEDVPALHDFTLRLLFLELLPALMILSVWLAQQQAGRRR